MPARSPDLTDRAELEAWLDTETERLAGMVRSALRAVVGESTAGYLRSLTAAGDLTWFDRIPSAWRERTPPIVGLLGELWAAGAVTAWFGSPAARQMAGPAAPWWQTVYLFAESYMAGAENRMIGVGNTTWQHVRGAATQAVTEGWGTEKLKDHLETLTEWSEHRADTVARTEVVGAYVNGDAAGVAALGDNGPTEKVWVATHDTRTRESHAEAHDQAVPVNTPFVVGGVQMMHPHAPGAPAGEVVNCRCYTEYLYPGDTRPDGTVVPEPEPVEPEPASA